MTSTAVATKQAGQISARLVTSITDQIALCVAGIVSQSVFTWQTHRFAGASDYARVFKLVEGLTDAESLELRHAGYVGAREVCKSRDRG